MINGITAAIARHLERSDSIGSLPRTNAPSDGWRNAARALAVDGVEPASVVWSVGAPGDLFGERFALRAGEPAFSVPRRFVELGRTVIQAREPQRFGLLYRLLRRQLVNPSLLDLATDVDVVRAGRLAQAVRRDTHKMRAFVRFREVGQEHVAWFEPAHYIVEANAAFFVERFATMRWTILTPDRSAHWDGQELSFGPGADPSEVPDDDALEAYWRTYFSAIFNPARLKIGAMTSEMPRKYWKNLPETQAIPELLRTARSRETQMVEQPVISPDRPRHLRAVAPAEPAEPLAEIAAAAATCRACPLWQPATQLVFGEGDPQARIMLVGEQPGDQEDLAGRPFVGPAGQILDRALREVGLDRAALYMTNAVKHFKFEVRNKRRIHVKPGQTEVVACRTWLERERAQVRPHVTVLLGATACLAMLGRNVTISRERSRLFALGEALGLVTVHPSYLLRQTSEQDRAREYAALVADLRMARSAAYEG